MKTRYNTTIELENISSEQYDMLIDFLESNNYNYNETNFEEFEIDDRTENEKYDDWLSEQADIRYDESKMEE